MTRAELLKPGQIFGDYRVERILGSGGMGSVYLVKGSSSGNEFAVKILDPAVEATDAEFQKRFLFEAELAQRIHHPNLIEVYDVGRDPETGYAYILMEYVPGGTVRDRLEKWGALSLEEASDIVYRVAQALVVVNQHHIVHRDIKPDNILFTADGITPKLADLGVARLASNASQQTTLTQAGFLVGSPAYMSPEQMENSHLVDIRSDIHALGVTFWEMLAGRRPYEGEDALAIVAHAMKGEAIADIRRFRPDVPAPIAELIARMARPNVLFRVQKPQEITHQLEKIQREAALPFRPTRKTNPHTATDARGVWVALIALTSTLVICLAMIVWLITKVRDAHAPIASTSPVLPTNALPPLLTQTSPPEERPPEEDFSPEDWMLTSETNETPHPSTNTWTHADFPEENHAALVHYASCVQQLEVPETKEEALVEILRVVNAAREKDPDLCLYDEKGLSRLPSKENLSHTACAVVNEGKLFYRLEHLRRQDPELLTHYRTAKQAFIQRLSSPRTLTHHEFDQILSSAVQTNALNALEK